MSALFDAHLHLHDSWLQPHLDQIAADCAAAGIAGGVVNGSGESDWPAVAALAERFSWVRPSFGLHPWDVGNASPAWRETLLRNLDAYPAAAVGEIGLDRWMLERARPDDPRLAGLRRAALEEQSEAFRWQLEIAAKLDRPASIHCLDAWGALAAILRVAPLPSRGFLLHAYGGSAEAAREFAALGAYFSFNGAFLAPRQQARREVFARLPLDRLLVETDAPAMRLPASHRTHELPNLPDGTPINHPANLAAAYRGLAEVLNLPLADLVAQVAANFHRCFG